MLKIIKDLYKFERRLVGDGYDKALEYINKILPLKILEFKSGTQFESGWTVPPVWSVKEGWIKYKGKKILDLKESPFAVAEYSQPVHGTVKLEELKYHLFAEPEQRDAFPYKYFFYEKEWGFAIPHSRVYKSVNVCEGGKCLPDLKKIDKNAGKVNIENYFRPTYKPLLKKGEYEVYINSEFKKGVMKVGVHTIEGKTDREILLISHLDHAWQANDNLSGVACLIDLAKKLKKFKHTIKIIFCPETIGSIAYATTQDISKVDFVIAVDAVGNSNTLLVQKSFDRFARINYAVHLALHQLGVSYRKGDFRLLVGSDEYVFNDPKIGIPGILLSRYPYPEYHTSADTPDIIQEDKLKETQKVILTTIEIYEKDYIPERKFKGPLFRSKFGLQTANFYTNRDLDYLIYDIDGEKWLSEIVLPLGITYDYAYKSLAKLKKNGLISDNTRKKGKQKTAKQKLD